MAASFDGLRERWERMNSREQGLVTILGLTLVVSIILAMVTKITGGMDEIEAKNANSREALQLLAKHRAATAQEGSQSSGVKIPDKAVSLDTYIEGILSSLEVPSPTYPSPKESTVGNHIELSFEIKLKGLSIAQLGDFLEKVETGSKLVVIKEMKVDRKFNDKEKLDLTVTIATYKNKTAEKKGGDESKKEEG